MLAPAGLGRLEGAALRLAGPPRARRDPVPGEPRATAREVDTGGYKVITTLDWKMQKTAEKWVYAAARAPNSKNAAAILKQPQDPDGRPRWILGAARPQHPQRRGRPSWTTGPARSSPTSGGAATRQGQQEVPAPVRRPGRRLAPAGVGDQADQLHHRHRRPDADRLDDVHGRHHGLRRRLHADPGRQARARPGPPSVRAPVLAQHPGHQGDDHQRPRPRLRRGPRNSGSCYPKTAVPVHLDGHRHAGGPPDRPARRLRHDRQRRRAHAATTIIARSSTRTGKTVWPIGQGRAERHAGRQRRQAAYIVTDILAGNTDTKVNPYWGKWAIYDGKTRRPAAYKTGTTNDNRDVAAYGYLAPPKRQEGPALAVGVWMGNSDNSPNDGKLSLDTSAPLWSAILPGGQPRVTPIAKFKPPAGLETAAVDAFTRPEARPVHDEDGQGAVHQGHGADPAGDAPRSRMEIDAATGLLWQEGCAGPRVTRGCFDLSRGRAGLPGRGRRRTRDWGDRAARGSGVRGGPKGTRTSYFYNSAFAPFGRTWGAPFAPTAALPALHRATGRRATRSRSSTPIPSRTGSDPRSARPTDPRRRSEAPRPFNTPETAPRAPAARR